MTDPIDLLDEASWLDTADLRERLPIRDYVLSWDRTVGDLRRLIALARDAERLRAALELAGNQYFEHDQNCGLRTATSDGGECDCGVANTYDAISAALEGTALAEPKQGSGPPGKGPYDPDRIGARVAALGGTDR